MRNAIVKDRTRLSTLVIFFIYFFQLLLCRRVPFVADNSCTLHETSDEIQPLSTPNNYSRSSAATGGFLHGGPLPLPFPFPIHGGATHTTSSSSASSSSPLVGGGVRVGGEAVAVRVMVTKLVLRADDVTGGFPGGSGVVNGRSQGGMIVCIGIDVVEVVSII
jgi:hypothetical protein